MRARALPGGYCVLPLEVHPTGLVKPGDEDAKVKFLGTKIGHISISKFPFFCDLSCSNERIKSDFTPRQ